MAEYGVIFDMDGVLVDSYRAHFESWNRMLRPRGLEMTERQFADTFGWTSREIIPHFWPDSVRDEEIASMDAEKEAAYRQVIAEDFPEMDGAGELIASLYEAGAKLGVGSSGPPENVDAVMKLLPGADLFSATANGREVERGKPDPQVFLLCASKLSLAPERCAVVEDAPSGVEAARRAQMAAIAITGTAPRERLAQAGADLVVDSLCELTAQRVLELIDARADT